MAVTGINAVKRYAKLYSEKKEAERTLKTAAEGMTELESTVVDYFQKHGVSKQTVDGLTVHLRRELWAGHEGDADAACVALIDAGLQDYAKPRINTQSLSAYCRELDAQDDRPDDQRQVPAIVAVHPELKGFIKVSEVFKIGVRAS